MLKPGTPIERYLVQETLGQGGMATVYRVKHSVLGTQHALKVLRDPQEGLVERLIREGQLQARLDPTRVVPVTDVLTVGDLPALLMPLVDGRSLRGVLEFHDPDDVEIRFILTEIAKSLASAHDAGIVHRDLKPGNVLMELHRGRLLVRVSDFGIAMLEKDTHQGQHYLLGTPGFSAPEQFDNPDAVDTRADLWSLGAMAFELMTGTLPTAHGFNSHAADFDRNAFPIHLIPDLWFPLLDGLLAPRPSDRWGSVDEVIAWLSEHAPSEPPDPDGPLCQAVRQNAHRQTLELSPMTTLAHATHDSLATQTPHSPYAEDDLPALPTYSDQFIGRQDDLDQLATYLDSHLGPLQLVGPAGVGKSRLLIQFATTHPATWCDGVRYCDFAAAHTSDEASQMLARALGIPTSHEDLEVQLQHWCTDLGPRTVILDNVDEIPELAGAWATRWSEVEPQLRIILTCRHSLGETFEIPAIHVNGMDITEAATLFFTRAESANSQFLPTAQDRADVRSLIDRIGALPLIVELAAAQTATLSVQEILSLTKTGLFTPGAEDSTSTSPRVIRAMTEWVWAQLSPWDQRVLQQLHIFKGGFTLEAAAAVIRTPPSISAPPLHEGLEALVEKSLIRPQGDGRFSLSGPILDLTALQQTADVELKRRYVNYFSEFGRTQAIAELNRLGGEHLRKSMEDNLSNLLAACDCALTQKDGPNAVRTLCAAWEVIRLSGPPKDIIPTAKIVAEAADLEPRLSARAMHVLAEAYAATDQKRAAVQYFQRALKIHQERQDQRLESVATTALAMLNSGHGLEALAMMRLQQAMRLAEAAGDSPSRAHAIASMAHLHRQYGRYEKSRKEYESAFTEFNGAGNVREASLMQLGIAECLYAMSSFLEAQLALEFAMPTLRLLWPAAAGAAYGLMAKIEAKLGRPEQASQFMATAESYVRRTGLNDETAKFLARQALVYLLNHRRDDAQKAYDQALALHQDRGGNDKLALAEINEARHALGA